ncbi:MAG: GNAT family N-acetyltransferase [Agathobacter sp.]
MLPSDYDDGVMALLKETDGEFFPPLSTRTSTTQKNLVPAEIREPSLEPYFGGLKKQAVILATREDAVAGILSFIPRCRKTLGDREYDVLYITTVIVGKKHRRKGISTAMYEKLMQEFPDRDILIRTWSENQGQRAALEKLGFRLIMCIPDDRGKGMDTVYYEKRRSTL